jgi:hypothetical protein
MPPQIVVTKLEFLDLVFLGTCDHILDFFVHFKYITLTLNLNWFILKETPTNIYKLEHMKYICVKKIHIIEYEKLQIYFKTKVMGGVL